MDEKVDRLMIIDPNRPDNNITGGSNQITRIIDLFSKTHEMLMARLDDFVDPEHRGNNFSFLEDLIGGNFAAYQEQRRSLHRVFNNMSGKLTGSTVQACLVIGTQAPKHFLLVKLLVQWLTTSRDCTTLSSTISSGFGTASTAKAASCCCQADWQGTCRRELSTLSTMKIQLTSSRRTIQRAMQTLPTSEAGPTNRRSAWNV